MNEKVRREIMGKVVSFYKAAGKKKRESKKIDAVTEDDYLLLYYNLFLTKNQANMLKKIFASQLKVHTGHRKDYVVVLESTLEALHETNSGTGTSLSVHVYEIYYFEKIIEFEMEMYGENYNALDMMFVKELSTIINTFKENNKEYIDEFASKSPEEKYAALVGAWNKTYGI